MKKHFFVAGITILSLLVIISIFGLIKPERGAQISNSTVLPARVEANSKQFEITFEEKKYHVYWANVDGPLELDLIPNFDQKLTSEDVWRKYSCQILTNAGFYDKKDLPLGLLIVDGIKQSAWQKNMLLDGVLSINIIGTPRITNYVPKDTLINAVQAGPILIENSFTKNLRIKNDKYARRVISVITGDNKLIFLTIYDPKSVFMGPMLSDLPEIIEIIDEEQNFGIADAINLDGGSASVFITENKKLKELSFVGAFFCLK